MNAKKEYIAFTMSGTGKQLLFWARFESGSSNCGITSLTKCLVMKRYIYSKYMYVGKMLSFQCSYKVNMC